MRRRAWIGIMVLLAGCPAPQEQWLFVNLREEPVELTYRGAVYVGDRDVRHCEIMHPWMANARDAAGLTEGADWNQQVVHRFDGAACEISVTVPPRSAMRIANRSSCGAVRAGAPAPPRWPPTLGLLRVVSAAGAMEWTGWEVSRAFTFERHVFGNDICRFELR